MAAFHDHSEDVVPMSGQLQQQRVHPAEPSSQCRGLTPRRKDGGLVDAGPVITGVESSDPASSEDGDVSVCSLDDDETDVGVDQTRQVEASL